jgi:hypothetical protein
MPKKHPFPADLPPADPTLKAGLYDTLAPRLALLPQEVALAHARSVVLSLCHMAGVRRVRAFVAAADAEGLVDLGARTLSALNPAAVSLASSARRWEGRRIRNLRGSAAVKTFATPLICNSSMWAYRPRVRMMSSSAAVRPGVPSYGAECCVGR